MRNRWVYVIVGFVMNVCLGTVYSWSVFRPPLHKPPFGLSPAESILPFSLFLLFFGVMFSLSGLAVSKYGPRRTALIGAILVGLGYLFSSLISVSQGLCLPILLLGFGAMAGTGCAFAYNPPIATSGRWFPDKRGLALGLTVMGFGLSSLFTAPLVATLVGNLGISQTFVAVGLVFLATLFLLGSTLKFPASDWKAPAKVEVAAKAELDFGTREMLGTSTFYVSWLVYLIGAGSGLAIIGYAKQIALDVTRLPDSTATLVVSLLAVSNAVGRPAFGKIVDAAGPKKALALNALLQLVSLLVFMPMSSNPAFLLIGIILLGATFGAYLAVMPALISYFYGTKNLGPNYGICFSAYGMGGIIMPVVVSSLLGPGPTYAPEDYARAFYAMGAMVALSFALSALMRPVLKKAQA
ncbi:MAG: OFA family MFS transporter [Candidatus Brockarchaeota archaeon]|nr:OFA family MFS transporter [Candidatus Brockarchaeota archaeon]